MKRLIINWLLKDLDKNKVVNENKDCLCKKSSKNKGKK